MSMMACRAGLKARISSRVCMPSISGIFRSRMTISMSRSCANPPDRVFPVVHVHHVPTPGPKTLGQGGAESILVIHEKNLGHSRF